MLELDNITLTHRVAKGVVKGLRWRPGQNVFGALRTAVVVMAHRMCTDSCKSLPKSLKFNSLTPHEASELDK